MESRLKQARLPWVKTLEQFDFSFQPGIDRKVVRELAGLAFVERSVNVILLDPPGVGKTHLTVALGVKAADAGHRVLFMPLDRLVATLIKAKQENRLQRRLQQQLSYARVLILDKIGYLCAQAVEAVAHVGDTRHQPYFCAGWQVYHGRPPRMMAVGVSEI